MVRTEGLSITAVAVGAIGVLSFIVPGLIGMLACGVAAIAAIILGTATLLRDAIERLDRGLAVAGIALGTLALVAQWLTHIAMSSSPQ